MALLAPFDFNFVPLELFLEPLSKLENVSFSPGDPPYNTHSHSGVLIKSALSRNPRAVLRVATPLFPSISFLLIPQSRRRGWWGLVGGQDLGG